MTRPRLSIGAAAGVSLLALALILTALAGPASGDDPTAPGAARINATYETAFAAFTRERVPNDTPPGVVLDSLASPVGPAARDRARLLNSGAPRVYLARTGDGACVAVEFGAGASTACTRDANLLEGSQPPIGLLSVGDGRWRVVGVFPNGTTDVRAHDAAGRGTALALDGNVATAVFDDPPALLTWKSPSGSTESHAFPNPETVGVGPGS